MPASNAVELRDRLRQGYELPDECVHAALAFVDRLRLLQHIRRAFLRHHHADVFVRNDDVPGSAACITRSAVITIRFRNPGPPLLWRDPNRPLWAALLYAQLQGAESVTWHSGPNCSRIVHAGSNRGRATVGTCSCGGAPR